MLRPFKNPKLKKAIHGPRKRTINGATNTAIWTLEPMAIASERSILSLPPLKTAVKCSAHFQRMEKNDADEQCWQAPSSGTLSTLWTNTSAINQNKVAEWKNPSIFCRHLLSLFSSVSEVTSNRCSGSWIGKRAIMHTLREPKMHTVTNRGCPISPVYAVMTGIINARTASRANFRSSTVLLDWTFAFVGYICNNQSQNGEDYQGCFQSNSPEPIESSSAWSACWADPSQDLQWWFQQHYKRCIDSLQSSHQPSDVSSIAWPGNASGNGDNREKKGHLNIALMLKISVNGTAEKPIQSILKD